MRAFLRLLVAAAALAAPLAALAQQPGNTTALVVSTCGTPPSAYIAGNAGPLTVDTTGKLCTSGGGGTPGGTNGQVQFNNAGAFGGFTVSGDGTLNTSTGALVVTKTNGVSFGALATVTLNGTSLLSDATNVTALRNSTSAQKLSIYNTFTDASNYERGIFDWAGSANVLSIGTENAGTGSARNLRFLVGGVNKLDYGVSFANAWTTPVGFEWGSNVGYLNSANGQIWMPGSTGGIGFTTNTVATPTSTILAKLAAGVVSVDGNVALTNPRSATVPTFTIAGGTVANLPSAATVAAGARATVTDAIACTFGGAITGGGSTFCPVFSDGSAWKGG